MLENFYNEKLESKIPILQLVFTGRLVTFPPSRALFQVLCNFTTPLLQYQNLPGNYHISLAFDIFVLTSCLQLRHKDFVFSLMGFGMKSWERDGEIRKMSPKSPKTLIVEAMSTCLHPHLHSTRSLYKHMSPMGSALNWPLVWVPLPLRSLTAPLWNRPLYQLCIGLTQLGCMWTPGPQLLAYAINARETQD